MSSPYMHETWHARHLAKLLREEGMEVVEEYDDGHKHIDIALHSAKICIEVDGIHHWTSPEQIMRDFTREHYSEHDGWRTIHIPNLHIFHHGREIARAIADVSKLLK